MAFAPGVHFQVVGVAVDDERLNFAEIGDQFIIVAVADPVLPPVKGWTR